MKNFIVLIACFVLSTGVALSSPLSFDCGDDDDDNSKLVSVSKIQS